MTKFKDDLLCNVALCCTLAFSLVHILFLMLNLFGATNFNFGENFSYIIAFVLVALCLALYIVSMLFVNRRNYNVPKWIRLAFYFAFFFFTNTYYILGWFKSLACILILFAFISILVTFVSLSIFYNWLKDDKNRLQVSNRFLTFMTYAISLAINFIIMMFVIAVSSIFKTDSLYNATTNLAWIGLDVIASSLLVIVSFALSLRKTKKWINLCLIKVKVEPKVRRSVKDK